MLTRRTASFVPSALSTILVGLDEWRVSGLTPLVFGLLISPVIFRFRRKPLFGDLGERHGIIGIKLLYRFFMLGSGKYR